MGYIDSFKSFNKKPTALEEQSENPIMNVPLEFESEQVAINNLKNDISTTEQDLAQKKADLNRLTQELQTKISAKSQQDAQDAAEKAKEAADQAQANAV